MIDIIKRLGGKVNPERNYNHQVSFEYNGFEMYISNNRKPKMFTIGVSKPQANRNTNHYDADKLWDANYSPINISQSKTIENIVHDINKRFDWDKLEQIKDLYEQSDQHYQNQIVQHKKLVEKISQLTGLKPRDSNDEVSTLFYIPVKSMYGQIHITYQSVSFEMKSVDNPSDIEKICKLIKEMQ